MILNFDPSSHPRKEQNQKSKIQNPKPKIQNPKSKTQNPKSKINLSFLLLNILLPFLILTLQYTFHPFHE